MAPVTSATSGVSNMSNSLSSPTVMTPNTTMAPDDRLQLTVEHRSAPAPDPLLLRLSGGGDQPLSLLVDSADAPPPPLPEAVRAALRSAGQPLSRTVLRQRLRVNNARLGVALQSLQQRGLAVRCPNGLDPVGNSVDKTIVGTAVPLMVHRIELGVSYLLPF